MKFSILSSSTILTAIIASELWTGKPREIKTKRACKTLRACSGATSLSAKSVRAPRDNLYQQQVEIQSTVHFYPVNQKVKLHLLDFPT